MKTPEDALKQLRESKDYMLWKYGREDSGLDDYFDMVETAEIALEKQVGKKPKFLHMLSDTLFKTRCDCGYVFTADINYAKNIKYCPYCGQKLDWSDEE